jgi:DNA-binding MarR family transcriptional regulator
MTSAAALVETTVPKLGQPDTIFDLLNFRMSELYSVSGSLVTRMCEGEFGITREEWAFIAMMAALGPQSPTELAAQTTADRSQTARTIRTLTEKKLVLRDAVAGDRRRAIIRLSAAGQAMYRRVFPRVVEVHQAVLAGLSAEEVDVLARCICKMQVSALEAQRPHVGPAGGLSATAAWPGASPAAAVPCSRGRPSRPCDRRSATRCAVPSGGPAPRLPRRCG